MHVQMGKEDMRLVVIPEASAWRRRRPTPGCSASALDDDEALRPTERHDGESIAGGEIDKGEAMRPYL
jgi:hypothetical protein